MNTSAWQKATQYALICAMIIFASKLLFYLSDFVFWFFGLGALVSTCVLFIVVFSVVMINWKKGFEEITYGQAFKFGLMVLAVYVVVMFALDLVFAYLIAPNFNEQMVSHSMASMAKMGLPQDQLDAAQEKMEKRMTTPIIGSVFAMLGRAVFDVIVLLVVAAVAKKEKE